MFDGGVQLGDQTYSSSVCARCIEPGPKRSGCPQAGRNGRSVVYGNTAVSKPGTVDHPHRRHAEHFFDIDTLFDAGDRPPQRRGVADGAKHHFSLRGRGHDIRRDAAVDQADGIVRASEDRVERAARSTEARRAHRSACRSPNRRARETTSAPRVRVPAAAAAERRAWRDPDGCRRLAVDQIPAAAAPRRSRCRRRRCPAPRRRRTAGRRASRRRAAAVPPPRPAPPKCLSRRRSRGRTAVALDAAREKRRDAVEVRREHDGRRRRRVASTLNAVVDRRAAR